MKKDRSHWRVWIGNIEDAPSNWSDWRDKTIEERLEEVDNIRSIHHNGEAGIMSRLERVIKFVDIPPD